MNLILFDDPVIRVNLLPFTYTRPTSKIRIGILTIAEKWEQQMKSKASFITQGYLNKKFPTSGGSDNLLINGAICPDPQLVKAITALKPGHGIAQGKLIIAERCKEPKLMDHLSIGFTEYPENITVIDHPWKIFQLNAAEIKRDYELITTGRKSCAISDSHTRAYNEANIFVEEGVSIRAAVLNAEDGPIYLGRNSIVEEGALIKGPFSLGEGSRVNMGAKMRGDSTIGPYCKVGGEISNSVIFGFSNKAHDGFIGNTVIGEWCNLGADTNTSNLKNNYEEVKLWSHATGGFIRTGLQFCGLMMGDHSKCGINTMFNTGTVVGISANIFGDGFPRNFIPSFAWGGANGFTTFQLPKALETAERVMGRRNSKLEESERAILTKVFEDTAANRIWDKK